MAVTVVEDSRLSRSQIYSLRSFTWSSADIFGVRLSTYRDNSMGFYSYRTGPSNCANKRAFHEKIPLFSLVCRWSNGQNHELRDFKFDSSRHLSRWKVVLWLRFRTTEHLLQNSRHITGDNRQLEANGRSTYNSIKSSVQTTGMGDEHFIQQKSKIWARDFHDGQSSVEASVNF